MDFAKFLSSIRKKDSGSAPSAPPEPPRVASPEVHRAVRPPAPSMESAVENFNAIQELLQSSVDVVRLPCGILIRSLPAELRGPAWKSEPPPGLMMTVDRENLVAQLKKGRVVYTLGELSADMPENWIKDAPEAMVELRLPEVVEALPDNFFRTSAQVSEEMIEVANMRDYFGPEAMAAAEQKSAEIPASPAPEPPRPAPAVPQRKAAKKTVKPVVPAWDGVDRIPDSSPDTIDINTAKAEDLFRIPGVGRFRAELIIRFRESHGLFQSVFDLADIRGIGKNLFGALTGLNAAPTMRRDRHEVMNALLGLAPAARPALAEIMDAAAQTFNVRGIALGGLDGVLLAKSAGMGEEADRYVAATPLFMKRSRRHLKRLCGKPVRAIALPTALPPLLLITAQTYALAIEMKPEVPIDDVVHNAAMLTEELDWLLRPRVVVRAG